MARRTRDPSILAVKPLLVALGDGEGEHYLRIGHDKRCAETAMIGDEAQALGILLVRRFPDLSMANWNFTEEPNQGHEILMYVTIRKR